MTGPLAGVRIIEIASLAPAPFGCMLLADLGAQVLRVERATNQASFTTPPGPLDRGRRTVALDLKSDSGLRALFRLAESADVFVEGFRPGVAERLGFGPDALTQLNSRLIYGRMTGWGQHGPLAHAAGHDINYISIAGALDVIGPSGEKPNPPVNLLGDFGGGGAYLALGILAALYEREQSGRGQVIDAAMVDGASSLMSFMHGMHAAGQWSKERGSNLLDGGASYYDTYETADGKFLAVGALEPQFYKALIAGLGLGPRIQRDSAHWPEEKREFAHIFKTRTRDGWMNVFDGTDACVSPVLSPWEAHLHPHNQARNAFIEVDGIIQPAPAPRFSRTEPPTPVGMDAEGRDPAASLISWGIPEAEAEEFVRRGNVR